MSEIKFIKTKEIGNEIIAYCSYSDGTLLPNYTNPNAFKLPISLKKSSSVISGNNKIIICVSDKDSDTCFESIGIIIGKSILDHNIEKISIDIKASPEQQAQVAFGILNRVWKFDKYKSNKDAKLKTLSIVSDDPKSAEENFSKYQALLSGLDCAKTLASEPANIMYPEIFAKQTLLLLKKLGVKVNVLDKNKLKKLNMNTILAVSQGSSKPPYVVTMEYKGNKAKKDTIAFVGKGVCFDAGGLFIKDQTSMPDMKYDKSGAASVVGAMIAIAKQKLKVNVTGVIGLVENMPDGNAQKPGDIIKSMSGKTIEIADTDAEGRLILADCLFYTQKAFKPTYMISFATLTAETGACLANEYAGLFTKDDNLADLITKAGKESTDCVWRLPLGKAFKKQIESDIADVKNVGDSGSGENAAAAEFLFEFVNNTKFAHLDIASVAWLDSETTEKAKGPTGFGVRLMNALAKTHG